MTIVDGTLFAAYTATSACSLVLLKMNMPFFIEWIARSEPFSQNVLLVGLGAALYAISFAIWMAILSRNDLSFAYPVAIGLTLAVSSAAAVVFVGEHISGLRVIGMLLVFSGVFVLVRS